MPAPLYQYNQIPYRKPDNAHAGLWFERFFNGYTELWEIPKPDKKTNKDVKRDWINSVTGKDGKVGNQQQLEAFQERQQTLIKNLDGDSRCYKTDWHFVTGMGNPHPVENGFTWHPTLAVPYLAGSTVKGLVRAWVEMNDDGLKDDEKKARLKHWFGTEDAEQAGNFIFFDAIPSKPPTLLCDIMTPHMGKWYEQGDTGSLNPDAIPADWHEPVPVPFLAVKEAQFVFSIAVRNPNSKPELAKVFKALNDALLWLGAGAKTAAGYGYMEEDEKATAELNQQQKQSAKKAEDDAKVANMTEAQRLIFELRQEYEKAMPNTQKIGGTLNARLTAAINQAAEWSNEDKQALLTLGNEINKTLWDNNKNVKDRLKTLQV